MSFEESGKLDCKTIAKRFRNKNPSETHVNSDDEFIVNATNDKEETKKMLSVGFEYVCQKDDIFFFRKRK